MTIVIRATDVNDALASGVTWLHVAGEEEVSRNGAVVVAPGPVLTEYERPWQRVLWSQKRNANPVFHLMEALWMLAGRNDVEFVAQFAQRMATFSDDGHTLHGAYGWRWRNEFNFDQLNALIDHLRRDLNSRRAVLQMWDCTQDLGRASKDLPCNTHIYVDTRGGKLNLHVLCRSNDIIWGCYGANYVHFGFLQEYLAMHLAMEVGILRQTSHNYHLYPANVPEWRELRHQHADPYLTNVVQPTPLIRRDSEETPEQWETDLRRFMSASWLTQPYQTSFFSRVAVPIRRSWLAHRAGAQVADAHRVDAYQRRDAYLAEDMDYLCDWRLACVYWYDRADLAREQRA